MDCREFLLRYSDYDDSLIPAHEADRFRAHMAVCPSCARYDRVLRKGRMLARQLPQVEPSPDFMPRLRMRLRQLRSRRRSSLGARLATGLAAATILLVAVSAIGVLDRAPETVVGTETALWTAPPSLPATGRASPRSWTAREVAPAVAASYSPLETGPPAYRPATPSFRGLTDSDRRALD